MNIIKDLYYGEKPLNKLDFYIPDNKDFTTIVYFHGGGLKEGDKSDHNYVDFGKTFTDNGYAFVSVNYRMYPKNKFPDFLYDAANSIKYVFDHIKEYNGSGEVIVSGQSAGAWMSLMIALDNKYLNSVGIDPFDIPKSRAICFLG